jgi:hypothetical protein
LLHHAPVGDGGLLPDHRPDGRSPCGTRWRGLDRARPVEFLRKDGADAAPSMGVGIKRSNGRRDASANPAAGQVEFFNLILGTKLTAQEKQDLVVFLRAL